MTQVRQPLARRQFAEGMIAALREEGIAGEPAEWDELENRLTYPDVRGFNLEENYLEAALQATYVLTQLYRAYAHLHVHPPTAPACYEQARKVIFPYVRPMAYHAHLGFRRLTGEFIDVVPFGGLTEHVTVCVGIPTPVSTFPAKAVDLERWGVTLEAALDQGRANVAAVATTQWQASPKYPGAFRATWKDPYGISRILFREVFRAVALRGDPVLVLPTWQTCFMAGSDDEQGLVSLARLARAHLATDSVLMYRPIRLRGQAMEHWLPPQGHLAHVPLRFLHAVGECNDYVDQAGAGRRFFERQEKPSNIPAPQVFEVPGGLQAGTIRTWREGPACALPRTDFVVFKSKTETLGAASWDSVQRVLGGELKRLDIYPPRWLGEQFPSAWQLSELNLRPLDQRPGNA